MLRSSTLCTRMVPLGNSPFGESSAAGYSIVTRNQARPVDGAVTSVVKVTVNSSLNRLLNTSHEISSLCCQEVVSMLVGGVQGWVAGSLCFARHSTISKRILLL